MTDFATEPASTAQRRPGKRERLIAAAVQLLHQQGVEKTTIADIAQAADVPPGNVYYYFKTKDELITSVVDTHRQHTAATLADIEKRHRTPKGRLKALVAEFAGQSEIITQYGCPLGSLCSEIDKRVDGTDFAVAELMRLLIEWAERQFKLLGRRDARDLAVSLIAAYEGSALLSNTLRDPNILSGQAHQLERWIETL